MKRTPFIADERTLKWCARQVRRYASVEDGAAYCALHRAADNLLDGAPRIIKPRKLTPATTLCGPVPKPRKTARGR